MFLEYFRLREHPFGVTPDPRFLFPSPGHREALASLLYGIETNLGFGTLIAEPGMGKTTLLFHILEQYRQSARTAFIFNTQCNSYDLLRSILSELDEDPSSRDTFQLHEKFKQVLATEAGKRHRVILVIDEAQNLGDMVMETVRLLSNFESADLKLLHIILSGQPELATKLARRELSQLKQRIPMLTQIPDLSPQDISSYIDHRLRVAGYQGTPLFSPEAVRHIVWLSRGIPREINRICFNSLSLAYASSRPAVDVTIIEEVATDLGLTHILQQARAGAAQQAPVAINATTASVGRATPSAQAWQNRAPGPRPVETTNRAAHTAAGTMDRNTSAPGPRFVPPISAGRPGQAVAAGSHPRSTLPPIQRVRRVPSSRSGGKTYTRPFAYAVFALSLIAAGWAAVTHWPSTSEAADIRKTAVSTQPSRQNTVAADQNVQQPVRQADRATTTNSPNPQNMRSDSQARPVESATPGPRRAQRRAVRNPDETLASLHSPKGSTPNPPPKDIPRAPVKEPTVADQGQMEFVRYVRPLYPEDARARHIEGTVVLSATVTRDGTVKGVKPVSGDPQLLKAAETAIRDWVYRPYQINGRPVDVDTEIVINFALPKKLN